MSSSERVLRRGLARRRGPFAPGGSGVVPAGGRCAALAVAALSRAAPEAAVLTGAAVLRFAALGRVPTDPYYDAAVRTMGMSWQALMDGAFEPGQRVAIDKPAPGLWLQVASTRLLGFGHWSLLLP